MYCRKILIETDCGAVNDEINIFENYITMNYNNVYHAIS